MRAAVDAELVEPEQRRPDDRRGRRRVDDEARADLVQAGLDPRDQPLVPGAKQAAAEQHLGRLLGQVEPDERSPRERDDLVREVVDDLRRLVVVRRLREDERRELHEPAVSEVSAVNRLGDLDGALEPEMRGHLALERRRSRRARPRFVRRRRARRARRRSRRPSRPWSRRARGSARGARPVRRRRR